MNNKVLFLFFLAFSFSSHSIGASLEDLDLLLTNNDVDIRRALVKIDILESQSNAVKAGYRPLVTAIASSASTSRQRGSSTEKFQGETFNLTVQQPILDGALLLENNRIDSLIGSERARLEAVIQSRRLELVREYVSWLSATAEYDLIEEQALYVDEKFELVSKLLEANRLTQSDLVAVQAEKYRIEARKAGVEASVDSAEAAIMSLTGSFEPLSWSRQSFDTNNWPFDKRISADASASLGDHPRLIAETLSMQSAQTSLRQAKRGSWPTILGKIDFTETNTSSDFAATPRTNVWSVALTAQWTLFDSGRTSAEIAERTMSLKDANLAVQQVARDLERRFAQSKAAISSAHAIWQSSKGESQSALKLAQLAEKRLENGVGTVSDNLAAVERVTDAKIRQRKSWLQGLLADAILLADAGTLNRAAILRLSAYTGSH